MFRSHMPTNNIMFKGGGEFKLISGTSHNYVGVQFSAT